MNAELIRPRPTHHGLAAIAALLALIPTGFGATFVVTNLASLGPGTLRQALSDNIALGGGNTIVFSNLTGTITLQGELSVLAPVTIRGPGTNVLAVSGNNLSRIFTVTAGPTLISDLTIRNGRIIGNAGQGMQEDGQDGQGGGIWNLNSALTISNCVVLSNSVVGGVGAERKNGVVGRGGKGLGGGVYSSGGTLLILNCSFEGNQVAGGRGGFAQSNAAGPGGDGQGGAIYTSVGTGQVAVCSFANNLAAGGMGGGIGGGSQPGAGGQGYGGGLYSVGPLTIRNSTLRGSTAIGGSAGDGTDNGIGNGYGGGLYSISTLTLISSTIVSNHVSGGGFNPSSGVNFGGGIFSGSDTGITNCTVASNRAGLGGGVYGTASAANSIFAGNTATNGPDINGTINSQDYNLIQNTNSASLLGFTTHCVTGQDPLLGPLQDNGGPTLTMALLSGSPALDQGKSFGLTTDQRGMVRPSNFPSITDAAGGDGSDIGAFELLPPSREFGADVSHFQNESGVSQASWDQMFAEGKRFVFIKATEGLTGPHDPTMAVNVARATAAGLLVGVYHYAHPENRPTPGGAALEASNMVVYAGSAIGPGRLRPVLDLEGSAANLSTAALTDWVIAFANEIIARRGSGAAPIIYCSQSFANNELDGRLANYHLWIRTVNSGANPAVDDPPGQGFADATGVFNNWSFWQYSATGSSGGISPLDLNVCHGEFKPLSSFLIPNVTPTAIYLTGTAVSLAGAFQFSFTNAPGVPFTVLATTNVSLPLNNWTSLGAVTEISPGQFQFVDLAATNFPLRFYRVSSP